MASFIAVAFQGLQANFSEFVAMQIRTNAKSVSGGIATEFRRVRRTGCLLLRSTLERIKGARRWLVVGSEVPRRHKSGSAAQTLTYIVLSLKLMHGLITTAVTSPRSWRNWRMSGRIFSVRAVTILGHGMSRSSHWKMKLVSKAILALMVLLFIGAGAYAQAPFNRLAGQWSGSGTIDMANGARERIKCRAAYDVLGDQRQLQLNIRCASESYHFDLRASATYSAGAISGTWSESTRGIGGAISGRADGEHFQVVARASSFVATLALVTHGGHQSVSIKTQDPQADIKGVSIILRRG